MEVGNLYTEFNKALFNFIYKKVSSQEDAEDILHNVFIRISGNIDKVENKEKLQSWIYAITRNAIIDHYRKKAITKNAVDASDAEDTVDETDADLTKGLEGCLKGFIHELPEEYRQIIVDSELHGIKQKDLASKYNLAYPSVRSRVQRGRERLKKLLLNCCHIEVDRRGNIIEARAKDNCDPAQSCDSCS